MRPSRRNRGDGGQGQAAAAAAADEGAVVDVEVQLRPVMGTGVWSDRICVCRPDKYTLRYTLRD